MKKINYSKNKIISLATYLTVILGIIIYFSSSLRLVSATAFFFILLAFIILLIIGVFQIENKPELSKRLFFLPSLAGIFLSIFYMIISWQEKSFNNLDIGFIYLFISSVLILFSIYLLDKIKKDNNKHIRSAMNTIDTTIISLIAFIGIILYIPSTLLLYPIGYFSHIIVYLLLFSVVGIFFIHKKPRIAKKLFLINGLGTLLTVGFYVLATDQDWTAFNFIFEILILSCLFILLSAYLLRKK